MESLQDAQVFGKVFEGMIDPQVETAPAKTEPAPTPEDKQEAAEEAAPKEETKTESKQSDQHDSRVPLAALHEERRKRQELEARLAEVERRAREPAKQEPKKEPEDEDAEFYRNPRAYVEAKLDAKLGAQREEIEKRRIDHSVEAAKRRYQDYQDAERAFMDAANKSPALWQEMRAQYDPAEYAYQVGKSIQEMSGVTDLGAYKAKIKAEAIAEYVAQQSQQSTKPPEPAAVVAPPSPGVGRGSPAPKTPHVKSDDEVFEDLFGRTRFKRRGG
jgi:hypothetical protein